MQAGRAFDEPRERVGEDRGRGHVAGHTAFDDQPQRRRAVDLDDIAGFRRADVHLQFERENFLAGAFAAGELVSAGHGALGDGEKFGFDGFFGEHGRDAFVHVVERPAKAVGEEHEGFGETDVADLVLLVQLVELRFCQVRADFALEGFATGGGIDDAEHAHRIDALAGHREQQRERVHDEARVDAGADDRDGFLDAEVIEFAREQFVAVIREQGFFAGGDAMQARADDFGELLVGVDEAGGGAMDHGVGLGLGEQDDGFVGDGDAEFTLEAEHFTQVHAGEPRIGVDRADELEARAVEDDAGGGAADGAEAVLNDTDWIAHDDVWAPS